MKKVLLTIAMLGVSCAFAVGVASVPAETVKATGDIKINETNFPDANFRKFIMEEDYGKDGILTASEIADLKQIYVNNMNISNLKGIEYFTELEDLYCFGNEITSLDVSDNSSLKILWCYGNKLTDLDVSKNTDLVSLYVFKNKLTNLDLSKNTKLYEVECQDNELNKLILPKNDILSNLHCYHNKLKNLEISDNPYLVMVHEKGWISHDVEDPDYEAYVYYSENENIDASLFYDHDTEIICNPDIYEIKADNQYPVCGKTTNLKVLLNNEPVKDKVSWKSSDDTIAKVDANGKVTTKMAGTVTVTATVGGKNLKCDITVLYKDVTNSKDFWYGPTNYMTALGVVKGYDKQTKFKPANQCTRAQMVTFLWRLKGSPEPKSDICKFSDVKKTDYFFKPVVWGNEQHVVEGYKDGTFGPQKVCQRKHAVTFLWRLAGCPDDFNSRGCKFTDVKKSDYFYYPVIWASVGGVLEGYKDGTFRPDGKCLRRQMVTFLYRFKHNNWTYDAED